MKFKKLHIRNFKCFKERMFEFNDGLNIVFGPNESGKSSLYQALVLSLFGFSQKTKKYHFGSLVRDDFTPLDTDIKPIISMTFSRGNSICSIERNFSESTVTVVSDIGKPVESSEKLRIEAARERIKELLGGIDEEIFHKYASISHYELSRLDAVSYKAENESMGELLIKMVESRRGEGISNVRKYIDEEMKNSRDEIKELKGKIEFLNEDLIRAKSAEAKIEGIRKIHSEISSKLIENQKRFNDLKTVFDSVSTRLQKEKDISELEQKLNRENDDFKRLSDAIAENENLAKQIKSFPSEMRDNYDSLMKNLDKYYDDEKSIATNKKTISEQIENHKRELEEFQKEYNKKYSNIRINPAVVAEFRERDNQNRKLESDIRIIEREIDYMRTTIEEGKGKRKFYSYSSIASVLIAAILFTLGLAVHAKLLLPIMLFITVVFVSISIILYLRGIKSFDKSLVDEFQKKSAELSNLEKQNAQVEAILTQLANKTGLSSREEMEDYHSQFRRDEGMMQVMVGKLINSQKEMKQVIESEEHLLEVKNSLLEKTGYKTLIDLEKSLIEFSDLQKLKTESDKRIERDNVNQQLESLTSSLGKSNLILQAMKKAYEQDFVGHLMNEDEFAIKKRELSNLENEIAALSIDKNKLDGQISVMESESGAGTEELKEQIDRTQNRLDSLNRKIEEIEYIKEIVNLIAIEYKSVFLPELQERALELFRSFAGKSDKTFSLEKWPEIQIFSTTLEGFREIHLSQGTRDQLYFALRISWSDILTPANLKLPLLWDDPFVYWDRDRTKGICKIAKKLIESGHQLIVFTHREDLLESFNEIFTPNEINFVSLTLPSLS